MEIEKYPLHKAAQNGDVVEAKRLLESGYDVNSYNENGITPLHTSAKYGHVNVAKLLLENCAIVDVEDNNGCNNTPLHMATGSDGGNLRKPENLTQCKNMIDLLVGNGANVNESDYSRTTILHSLASWYLPTNQAIATTKSILDFLILEHGAKVNCQNEKDNTPLHVAVKEGRLSQVKMFVNNYNANMWEKNLDGNNAIEALENSKIKERYKIHISQKDEEDYNSIRSILEKAMKKKELLYESVKNGNVEDVRKLFENNAVNVNTHIKHFDTALHMAATLGHVNVAQLLLKNGAIVDAKENEWDRTPLLNAVQYFGTHPKECEEIVRSLVKNGANVNEKDCDQKTILHFLSSWSLKPLYCLSSWSLIKNKNIEIMKSILDFLILEHGAKVNCQDENNNTPLHIATQKRDLILVKMLVFDYKANVNIKNLDMYNALETLENSIRQRKRRIKYKIDHKYPSDEEERCQEENNSMRSILEKAMSK